MKKYIIIALAALCAAVSCQKNAQNVVDPDENLPAGTLVPVKFASNLVTVSTKALGGIDAWSSNVKLNIYGIAHENGVIKTDDILIDNVQADAPDGADGAISVLNGSEPFYYDLDKKYEFFGYFADDAVTGAPVVSADAISVPVTIDGTQDIMLAKADRVADAGQYAPEKCYSAWSARKGVVPSLNFQHQLARFKFFVTCGTTDQTFDGKMKFKSLSIASPASGYLVVAGDTPGLVATAGAPEADLALVMANPLDIVTTLNKEQIGESLMVFPGQTEYTIKYTLSQEGKADDVEATAILNLAQGAAFEAGKQYSVNITVYSLESVKINVSLAPWDIVNDEINIGADD